jgi:hypothetical protein
MEKKKYIEPSVTVSEFDSEVLMSSVSSGGTLGGTEWGGESKGGMDADSKERDYWNEGLW